jgi:hypothetical protein
VLLPHLGSSPEQQCSAAITHSNGDATIIDFVFTIGAGITKYLGGSKAYNTMKKVKT